MLLVACQTQPAVVLGADFAITDTQSQKIKDIAQSVQLEASQSTDTPDVTLLAQILAIHDGEIRGFLNEKQWQTVTTHPIRINKRT